MDEPTPAHRRLTGPDAYIQAGAALARRAWSALDFGWGLVLDLFYPPRCGGCNARGTLLCRECLSSIEPPDVEGTPPGLVLVIAAGRFSGPLRTCVHNLKYESDGRLSGPLAALIHAAIQESFSGGRAFAQPPALVPVPLHSSRQRARGYNQSLLLAKELARLTGWPVQDHLERTRPTATQVGLSAADRKENVAGAFRWMAGAPEGVVILVDDVCTTGATLSECARAIHDADPEAVVYAATIARALHSQDSAAKQQHRRGR